MMRVRRVFEKIADAADRTEDRLFDTLNNIRAPRRDDFSKVLSREKDAEKILRAKRDFKDVGVRRLRNNTSSFADRLLSKNRSLINRVKNNYKR